MGGLIVHGAQANHYTQSFFFPELAWPRMREVAVDSPYLLANDLEQRSHENGFSFVSVMSISS